MGALPCYRLLSSRCLCLSSRCIGMRTSDVIPSGITVVDSRRLGRCTNTHRRNPAQRALGFGNTLVSTRYASRRLPMQANLNAAQENQKNENTRRMDVQPYIYMSGKSPGKMSRQTNRSVQTHYFKFKHQIKPPVTQYATTRPLYPASALSTGFYHSPGLHFFESCIRR